MSSSTPSPSRLPTLARGALLVLAHAPFLATRSFQDDAFITWRCAVQLADTGVYGFNPGERVSASTSHAYVALVALLRLVFGPLFIPATVLLSSVLTVASVWLLADVLAASAQGRDRLWTWGALTPMALVIASSGMEPPLVVFLVALSLRGLARAEPDEPVAWISLAPLVLLPWVRLDAAFAALVIGLTQAPRSRRLAGACVLAAFGGVASVMAFNGAYFGVLVNQSIVAKLAGLESSLAPTDIAGRGWAVYFSSDTSELMPLPSKFLRLTGPVFSIASILTFAMALRATLPRSARRATLTAMAIIALATTALYAAAGIAYAWYFWPSVLLCSVVVLAALFGHLERVAPPRRALRTALTVSLTLAAAAQWVVSYSAGVREWAYVTSVGRFVGAHREQGDRLFTDLGGSVPYFSGLPTDDEHGLVSPLVTTYRRRYGDSWVRPFLDDRRPTWVVLRNPLEQELAPQAFTTNAPDSAPLSTAAAYELVKTFHYDPSDFVAPPQLLALARLGTAPTFWVYRRRSSPSAAQ